MWSVVLNVRWPTSDNLPPHEPTIQRYHNDMTTTSQQHDNNTTTTPQFFWNKLRAVAAKTARSRCKVVFIRYVYYFRDYRRQMTLHMASESLLSCTSLFLRQLRNQWPWISLRAHSRSCILAAIESQCTTLYRPLIVTFALSSTVSEILPVLHARANCVSK